MSGLTCFSVLTEAKKKGIDLWVEKGELKFKANENALDNELKLNIIQYKAEIIDWLKAQNDHLEELLIPTHLDHNTKIPVTSEQLLFWRASTFSENGYEYNIPYAFLLEGDFHYSQFQQAFSNLVEEEPILRTHFFEEDSTVFQSVTKNFLLPLAKITMPDNEEKIKDYCTDLSKTLFDLEKGPCFLVRVIELSQNKHLICFVFHHIIADATSIQLIFKKLENLYSDFVSVQNKKSLNYLDYAFWQKEMPHKNQEELDQAAKKFFDMTEKSTLPFNKGKVNSSSNEGSHFQFELPKKLSSELKAFSVQHKMSLNSTLLSAYFVLLRRYSRCNQHCVGIPISTRNTEQKKTILGPLLNTAALLIHVEMEMSFLEVMSRVNNELIESLSMITSLPFRDILEKISQKTGQVHEIFNTMFLMQAFDDEKIKLDGCMCNAIDIPIPFSKFDLTISMRDKGENIAGSIEYKTDLFSSHIIEKISEHYISLLTEVIRQPEKEIFKAKLFTEIDPFKLDDNIHLEMSICDQISHWAQCSPNALAIYDEKQKISYAELWSRATQLAKKINSTTQAQFVGVLMERSVNAVIGILAILASGRAFLPIDTANPIERINYIVIDSKLDLVLVDQRSSELLPAYIQQFELNQVEYIDQLTLPHIKNGMNDIAYMIYTSGSSGQPKGVLVSHLNLMHYNKWSKDAYIHRYAIKNVLLHSSLAFDLTITTIFAPLTTGISVFVPEGDGLEALPEYVRGNQQLGLIKLTPSHLRLLLNLLDDFELSGKAGVFIVGGEALYAKELKNFLTKSPGLVFINEYGPTETTVGCAEYIVNQYNIDHFESDNPILIGHAIDRIKLDVLDERNQSCPPFIPGEIIISGMGVSQGYLNKPDLTQEKFITLNGVSAYKSGDLAIKDNQGELTYLGRIDQQVKLNGFRVELGEIEAQLQEINGVNQATVFPIEGNLIAFVILDKNDAGILNLVRQHVQEKFPHYMQPKNYILVNHIPLTINGKVDRNKLSKLFNQAKQTVNHHEHILEGKKRLIKEIWQEIFKLSDIDIDRTFFELGGDSIKVLQLTSRLKQQHFLIKPRDIYKHYTIRTLANYIDTMTDIKMQTIQAKEILAGSEQALLPAMQWFVELAHQNIHHYNQSFRYRITRGLNKLKFEEAIKFVIRKHPALRLRLDEKRKKAFYSHVDTAFKMMEVKTTSNGDDQELMLNQLQRSLNIIQGPALLFCFMQYSEDQEELVIVAHHFVIDAVSWSILINDLEETYEALLQGKEPILLAEGTSLNEWQQALLNYSKTAEFEEEGQYWKGILENTSTPYFDGNGDNLFGCYKNTQLRFEAKSLKMASQHFSTSFEALFLSMVSYGLAHNTNKLETLITLEHHGRELINDEIDLSRTIGWFTAQFPIKLPLLTVLDKQSIKSCSNSLDDIPNKGIGFGVLSYFTKEMPAMNNAASDICFNYLGEMASLGEGKLLTMLDKPTGSSIDSTLKRQFSLEINCYFLKGELVFEFFYDAMRVSEKWIAEFTHTISFAYQQLSQFNQSETAHEKSFGLGPLQKGLLYHAATQTEAHEYITQILWDINQKLDIDRFKEAWHQVVLNVEVLRTIYSLDKTEPRQIVLNEYQSLVTVLDLRELPASEQPVQLNSLLKQERQKEFNLFVTPPSRATIILLEEEKSVFSWTHHHIMMDGWSVNNLKVLLEEAYEGKKARKLFSYKPYIDYLEKNSKALSFSFWKNKFKDFEYTSMPLLNVNDSLSPVGELDFHLNEEISSALSKFANVNAVTPSAIIQGVWSLLLAHYKGVSDISFGVTFSHRPYEISQIEENIGLYINTLPIRIKIEEQSFLSLARKLQDQVLELVEHGGISIGELGECMGFDKPGRLINEIIVFESYPIKTSDEMKLLQLKNLRSVERTASGLVLVVAPGINYQCKLSFDQKQYSDRAIERIKEQFVHILLQVIEQPQLSTADIIIPTRKELDTMLVDWNKTQMQFPKELNTMHAYLDLAAKSMPDQLALIADEGKLTYREFKECADNYAQVFLRKGLSIGDYCVIHLDRSIDLIPVLYGILKCGGVLVALDVEYPEKRVMSIIQDCQPKLIISNVPLKHDESISLTLNQLKEEAAAIKHEIKPLPVIHARNLAYVIYTSGSTGIPKGVQIDHESATNMIEIIRSQFKLDFSSRVMMFASISFDAAVADWAPSVAANACLYLPARKKLIDPLFLSNYIDEHQITTITLPPSMLAVLPEGALMSVDTLVSAGESCPSNIVMKFGKGRTFLNGYGPSEATVCTSMGSLSAKNGRVSIGKPLANKKVYVLDQYAKPVALGAPGELYISGKGIARGYLNRDDLTQMNFMPDPFNTEFTLYKSGDKVRWLENGELEYLCRLDSQVKIRGYRVELSEIVKTLETHPDVSQACVILTGETDSQKLVAYIVPRSSAKIELGILKSYIKSFLPVFMIPQHIICIEKFPMNQNGKVDIAQLPVIPLLIDERPELVENSILYHIVHIFKLLLEQDVILDDDFFDLGGHSLLAVKLINEIEKILQYRIPLSALFELRTPRNIAIFLDAVERTHITNEKENSENEEIVL